MTQHADILDQRDSMSVPMLGALMLHIALAAAFLAQGWLNHTDSIGAQDAGGGAIGVEAVSAIPIPHQGMTNPLANDSESQVPQEKTKPEERVKAEKPPPDAVALKTKQVKKKLAEVASERQKFRPYDQLDRNQLTSTLAPQVSSPLFAAQPGAGRVGANTTLGVRFSAYGAQIQQLVAQHWRTSDVDTRLQTAPPVIASFDLMRDGSTRNLQILQSSGIPTLDFSVRRAIADATPFPPLPVGFEKDQARVEFTFELKR